MNSPSPSKYPDRDGHPLSALSPQRVNGRVARASNITSTAFSLSSPIRKKYNDEATFFSPAVQQSPSLSEFSAIRERFLPPTDVSGLVKRFEHLDVRDRDAESLERRNRYDEALDRAKIAREEAEDEAKKSREELRTQRKEFEACKDRERRACKRIDVLMDEFARAKEQWSSQMGVYEKEVRRARKEAFKSSSAVLKLQEENKHTINELRGTKAKLDIAQRKASNSEEEKFAAQYQLVAVQEELEKLQATLRIAREEREALKRSLHEEDIARIAAEGMIALPTADDELAMTARSREFNVSATQTLRAKELERDLGQEIRRKQVAHDLITFMKLECKFGCCSCAVQHPGRQSSRSAVRAANSRESNSLIGQPKTEQPLSRSLRQSDTPEQCSISHELSEAQQPVRPEESSMSPEAYQPVTPRQSSISPEVQQPAALRQSSISPATQQPVTPQQSMAAQQSAEQYEEDDLLVYAVRLESIPALNSTKYPSGKDVDMLQSTVNVRRPDETLQTPGSDCERLVEPVRMVTKTMKVPINFSPAKRVQEAYTNLNEVEKAPSQQEATTQIKTYPFDREAALAAIAYRRGRAKSFAQAHTTPKGTMVDGLKDRRDVSAPLMTG